MGPTTGTTHKFSLVLILRAESAGAVSRETHPVDSLSPVLQSTAVGREHWPDTTVLSALGLPSSKRPAYVGPGNGGLAYGLSLDLSLDLSLSLSTCGMTIPYTYLAHIRLCPQLPITKSSFLECPIITNNLHIQFFCSNLCLVSLFLIGL